MKDRLIYALQQRGLNQREFAQSIGVSPSSVSQWLSGVRVPQDAVVRSICHQLHIRYDWLVEGDGPMEATETADDMVDRVMQGSNDFAKSVFRAFARLDDRAWQALRQVVDALQSGAIAPPDPPSATQPDQVAGAPDPHAMPALPPQYADATHFRAVRARGDSMEPRIHSGDTVVAAIGTPPESDQIALVRLSGLADDEYVIKRVTIENGRYILRSDNPAYPPMTYTPEEIRACEAVCDVFPCK